MTTWSSSGSWGWTCRPSGAGTAAGTSASGTSSWLPGGVVLEVPEGDHPVGGDGPVETVHVVENALVHGFHPAVHIDLPLELPGLMDAGQPLQLADEHVAFPLGEEPAGLHRVHQQLQLRQLEVPLADV